MQSSSFVGLHIACPPGHQGSKTLNDQSGASGRTGMPQHVVMRTNDVAARCRTTFQATRSADDVVRIELIPLLGARASARQRWSVKRKTKRYTAQSYNAQRRTSYYVTLVFRRVVLIEVQRHAMSQAVGVSPRGYLSPALCRHNHLHGRKQQ